MTWEHPMSEREGLYPTNRRVITDRGGKPVVVTGMGLVKAAVPVEWLRRLCVQAGADFPTDCEPTQSFCPVTKAHHVFLGLRPGTADGDVNVYAQWEAGRDRCIHCNAFVEMKKP